MAMSEQHKPKTKRNRPPSAKQQKINKLYWEKVDRERREADSKVERDMARWGVQLPLPFGDDS
jgi:hypothetical protein